MVGGAAMAGTMLMQCTQKTVNPDLRWRFSTAGELGSCRDTTRGMLLRHYNVRMNGMCCGLDGFGESGIKATEMGKRSFGGGERRRRGSTVVVFSAGDKSGNNLGDDGVETLFMRELRRRGLSAKEKDAALGSAGTDTKTKEESEGDGSFFRGWSLPGAASTKPPPEQTQSQRDEQLKRSQALNSEGLDGLIPRGTELLKLGSSFFLGFWPLILASLAAFGAIYLYFGSAFIHTGNRFEQVGRPPYVDPYQLLEEDNIPSQIGPNRVPFNARTDASRIDRNSP
ncbi:unnamed protein product [Calypogeia fissa]